MAYLAGSAYPRVARGAGRQGAPAEAAGSGWRRAAGRFQTAFPRDLRAIARGPLRPVPRRGDGKRRRRGEEPSRAPASRKGSSGSAWRAARFRRRSARTDRSFSRGGIRRARRELPRGLEPSRKRRGEEGRRAAPRAREQELVRTRTRSRTRRSKPARARRNGGCRGSAGTPRATRAGCPTGAGSSSPRRAPDASGVLRWDLFCGKSRPGASPA